MFSLTRRRTAVAVLATVGLLVYGVLLFTENGSSDRALTGPVGLWILSVFANGCAVVAARASRGRQRLAWTVLSIGLAGWTAGQAVWWYVSLGGIPPMPEVSAANLGYVVLPLCAFATAVTIPSRDDSQFGLGLLLDGLLVAASLLIVLAILVLGHFRRPAHIVSLPQLMLATATAVYLGLVVMSLITVRKAEPGRKFSPTLMTLGWIVIAAAGIVRVFEDHPERVPCHVVIFGWALGMYFVALSGIASRPGPDLDLGFSQPLSKTSLWLPYGPVLLAIAVGGVHFWPSDPGDAFVFSVCVVLFLTTLARHLLLLDRKQHLLAALSDAALRDPLTGLANQRLFDDLLSHAVRLHIHHAVPVSVIALNISDFAMVNDTLGYPVADELLRSVGERLQANLRTSDTVARMNGDQFAVLVEDRPEVAAQVVRKLSRSFDESLELEDHRLHVHLNIGVASATSEFGSALTPGELLEQADAARSWAQQASSTDVQTFTPDMDVQLGKHSTHGDGLARVQLLGELRHAIDERLLTLLYQPKFDMLTGFVCGAEALVRWQHPELGTLAPSEFLPLVRQHGLMDAVTDLVLSRAVADASQWYAAGAVIPVAINLWAPSLDEDALPDRIMSVLDRRSMSASSLTIEITEDLLVGDLAKARAVLNRLREAGIRVAIDDFGSGYASLTYLRELPIDDVKLDHQFIAPILHDDRAATIARTVIKLTTTFGIATIAEGVGDAETAQRLKEYGCDAVQGNFFCPPLPAADIPQVRHNTTLAAL
ncbi:putative bifunctional diguanylate cyclase/phosphodiesterase [Mycobacterium montefiorense]|uniref:putative bifunctional diguanylate cyclase/phosphodiesterase n=3 Tax=Mycobacterium montefiorense TaxID=154654 RepID=UPI0021F2F3E5|nr:bifunctional diguanylate cyclase/phosphodiesterase [Mycobacterium montefiorense]MCV7425217.1 bifunctional diguanylate cyclase/phosphodiesterase [Mycobacterium montefiorense]